MQATTHLQVGAALAFALAAALAAFGVFAGEEIHWKNLLLGWGIIAVSTAIVFAVFVRRGLRDPRRAARTAAVFAVLALVTAPAFWSGLPPVFAVAALVLAWVGTRAPGVGDGARRTMYLAMGIALLAITLNVVLYVGDAL